MSLQLISRSPDLQQLQDEGYAIDIRAGYLLLSDVPYVTPNREIDYGTLVSELTFVADKAERPSNHLVWFTGEFPCDQNGTPLDRIRNESQRKQLAEGLVVNHRFSSKPSEGYQDYYQKMTTYAALIFGPAQAIDPMVTARTFKIIENTEEHSVFRYTDTASTRAGITNLTEKFKGSSIAIIGLGGTGSYILDFISKTPVAEIHLFDGDRFMQHNAFRAPGAATLDALRNAPQKDEHFQSIYSEMRFQIHTHGRLTEDNAHELGKIQFAFIAVDQGPSRKLASDKLRQFGVPFIDVGMGLIESKDSISGQIRTTVCNDHTNFRIQERIPYQDGENNDYTTNIQIAELNALNAALAVIKWKKTMGFYLDQRKENLSYFQIDGNYLVNEFIS